MVSADKLRKLRIDRGLTLKKTAHLIGVSTSTYRDWEYGSKIPANMLFKISQVLNINFEVLMGLKPESTLILEIIEQLDDCITKLKKI